MEIYEMVKGYENYTVSSWGKVYKVVSKTLTILPEASVVDNYLKEIKPQETSKGYLRVRLVKDGQKKWFKVHRLVAQAFIENPDNKSQVNHKDGNKKNNSVTNLEWVTDEENKEHQKRMNEGII